MLKIWGRTNSVNVQKVLWCAEELDVVFERIDAGGAYGLVNDAAFRRMNPNGLVPCIQDDDLVLWESNVIVRYLCAKHGQRTLYVEDPKQRALADQWMDWTTSSLAAPFGAVFWNLIRTAAEQRDMVAVENGLDACGKLLLVADQALSDQLFLSGDRFGMGDIPLGSFIHRWFEMPIERPDLPHLEAWYRRLADRPGYRQHVMIPLT